MMLSTPSTSAGAGVEFVAIIFVLAGRRSVVLAKWFMHNMINMCECGLEGWGTTLCELDAKLAVKGVWMRARQCVFG